MQLKEKEINAEQDRSLRNKVWQNYDEHWNFSPVLSPAFWSSPHVSVQALSEKAKNCFEHFHVCVWLTNCSLFLDSRWLYGFNKRERRYISTSGRTKKTDRYGKFHTALKILGVISMFLFKLLYQETYFSAIFQLCGRCFAGKLFVSYVWLVSTSCNRTQNHNFSRALSPVNVFASSHGIATFRIFISIRKLHFTF